jgi:hypothetical protein
VSTLAGLAYQGKGPSTYEPYTFTTLAGYSGYGSGDGTGSDARFAGASGVAVDNSGNVYVADSNNNTIRKGHPALRIPNSGFQAGQFGFSLTGRAGQSSVVEISTDLLSWLPLWTNTFAGALQFSDSQIGVSSNRFYRSVSPAQ